MPTKITRAQVMPALWTELKFDPAETERAVNRASFDKAMERSYTITSKSVRDREWSNLVNAPFSQQSPYYNDVVIINIQALKLQPYIQSLLRDAHTHHTHTMPREELIVTPRGRV